MHSNPDTTPNPGPNDAAPPPQPKSIAIAFLLTLLLGPIGMLYSTPIGALIMMVITIIIGVITFGIGVILVWPVCIIWSCVAAAR
jgi:hypothetical protein